MFEPFETNPTADDTDGDGLPDGLEDRNSDGRVQNDETDPRNPDSDADGLLDGQEDLNLNGIVDDGETDPVLADSDDDGIPDLVEVIGASDSDLTYRAALKHLVLTMNWI